MGDELSASALQLRARAAGSQLHARARPARVRRAGRVGAAAGPGLGGSSPRSGESPPLAAGMGVADSRASLTLSRSIGVLQHLGASLDRPAQQLLVVAKADEAGKLDLD